MAKKQQQGEVAPIKATGRGGKYNFPSTVPPEDPDDVRAALSNCLRWYKQSVHPAKTDEEVQQRTIDFFEYCLENGERPTIEKYSLALGYTRKTLFDWEAGHTQSQFRSDIIKKAKEFIASYDAEMSIKGKLNPVLYIFRGKNYYGLKDQQDVVLTPNSPLQADTNPVDIAQKYNALPED